MAERERGPTLDPPQPKSIDMGPHTFNGGGPEAADDKEEELHCRGVYKTDPHATRVQRPSAKNV